MLNHTKRLATCLVFLVVSHTGFAPSIRATQQTDQDPPKSSEDPLRGFTQPGDDRSPELKSSKSASGDKKAEAMAVYMDGLAMQKEGKLREAQAAFKKAAELNPTSSEPVRAHALLLMRLGRVKDAEKFARKAIALNTDDHEMRLQLALMLRGRNNGTNAEEAIRLVDEALQSKTLKQKSEDAIKIHKFRGALYLEAGVPQKASESYEVILDALQRPEDFNLDFRQQQALANDRLNGYEGIGGIMMQLGRNDLAITAFEGLVQTRKDVPGNHHLLLAIAQYRKDQLEKSNKNLNRYFESQQRSKQSLELLGDLYRAQNRIDDLPSRLEALAADSPDASAVRLFLGNYLIDQGKADEAAEVFKTIIVDSGDADAHVGLVRVEILNGDPKALIGRISKAIRARISIVELLPLKADIISDSDFATALVDASVELQSQGEIKTAGETFFYSQLAEDIELPVQEEQLLQATLEMNPPPRLGIEVMGRLGFNQLVQDKYRESAITYRRLLSIPGLPGQQQLITLYRLSQAESFNENYVDAIKAIDTALEMSPQNPELTYQRGWIQLQADNFDEAEKSLKSAAKLAEDDPNLESRSGILLGALYTQLRRWDEAIKTYEQIMQIPDMESDLGRRTRIALSNAYVQGGDLPNGQRILEEVYQQSPEEPGVNNDLGYLYADQGIKLEKAEAMIRLAVKAEPDNPAYLDSLGWVLFKLKKYDEALKVLEKANSDPDYQDSTIIEHLGDVQQALDNNEQAQKTWQKALKIEQDSATADDTVINRIKSKLAELSDTKPDQQ